MVAVGLAEMLSLGLLIPFLTALSEPQKIAGNLIVIKAKLYLEKLFHLNINLENETFLTISFTLAFLICAILSGIIRIISLKKNAIIANKAGTEISSKIYENLLNQNLKFHISQNSSEIISNLIAKTSLAIVSISAGCTIISSFILSVFITLALFIISPGPTFIIFSIVSAVYIIIHKINKKRFLKNSVVISKSYNQMTRSLQEGLKSIRDIILYNIQDIYTQSFKELDEKLRTSNAKVSIISQSPRFYIEVVGLCLFAIISYYFAQNRDGFIAAIPTLAALALGIQKILPALHQVYFSWAIILAHNDSTNDLLKMVNLRKAKKLVGSGKPFVFNKKIVFTNISFKYKSNSKWIFQNCSLTIKKGDKVALIGSTGSGKSTIMDLLMGLLFVEKGAIRIDNVALTHKNIVSWQNLISHVPQSVFITDKTVVENIALGIPIDSIDFQRVEEVSKVAQLDTFINSLPEKFNTVLGENGSFISGGQKQRIGIARALYKKCEVLILDEATSALDSETENKVINALVSFNKNLTIIFSTHRKAPLRVCSKIINIEKLRKT